MTKSESGSFMGSLRTLFSSGVRYGSVIDVGSADGHFCLSLLTAGLTPGTVTLNIDPNPLYVDSLRAISDTIGGHFRTCAATDHEGEVELTLSAHPYWASLRPKGDPYWQRINKLSEAPIKVPATTLDSLRAQFDLPPPYLLKLDVQGAEAAVLRGASLVLNDTLVVIVEADMDDFETINSILTGKNFVLYDITSLSYVADGRLGWFYPVYIHRSLDFVRPKEFWNADINDVIVNLQIERRRTILKSNAEILARLRNPQPVAVPPPQPVKTSSSAIGRNQLCPCGSGKRYKHCCGALA